MNILPKKTPASHAEILKQLASATTPERAFELRRECQLRRDWLHSRLAEISAPGLLTIPLPPERQRAMESGTAALEKLDAEIQRILAELENTNRIEMQCRATEERLLAERRRREIPKLGTKFEARVAAVESALKALDVALEAMNSDVDELAHHDDDDVRVPFPVSPDVLARAYAARERIWGKPSVRALRPPWSELYSESIAHAYTSSGANFAFSWGPRFDTTLPRANARILLEQLKGDGLRVELIDAA